MSYGTFESVETDGYDQQQRQAAVAQDLAVAMERVARQFGPYLNQASDKDDFNDRVAFVKPEMMKVVQAAGVMPVTGVMRKVVGAQRSAWRKRTAGKNAPRKTLAWRGVDQDAAQRFVQYATQNGVILKDWAHLEQLLDSFYLRDSEPWSQVGKTSFMIELRNNKDEVINAMRGSGVYASKVAFTMDDYERFYDDSDPKMREWVAQDPENRMVPANPFTNLQDFYNWKNAGKTGDGLEDAKDLIPVDNWDGYLKERETEDTDKVRHNFASKTADNGVTGYCRTCGSSGEDTGLADGRETCLNCGAPKKESSRRTANDEFAASKKTASMPPWALDYYNWTIGVGRDPLDLDTLYYYLDDVPNNLSGDQAVELEQYINDNFDPWMTASMKTSAVDDEFARAVLAADDDEPTTGDPTKPNTLNDDVLEGVEEGDEGKVSDNIETNSGDGSDSKGEKRSYRAASRQRKAGAGFTWENDGIGSYDLYGSPVNGGDVEDPHAEIFDDGEDGGFRVYVYKTEYDSGEMRDEISSLEEAKSWAEGKMMEYSGGGAQTSLFSSKERQRTAGSVAGDRDKFIDYLGDLINPPTNASELDAAFDDFINSGAYLSQQGIDVIGDEIIDEPERFLRHSRRKIAYEDRAFESAVLRTADDRALVNYIDTH